MIRAWPLHCRALAPRTRSDFVTQIDWRSAKVHAGVFLGGPEHGYLRVPVAGRACSGVRPPSHDGDDPEARLRCANPPEVWRRDEVDGAEHVDSSGKDTGSGWRASSRRRRIEGWSRIPKGDIAPGIDTEEEHSARGPEQRAVCGRGRGWGVLGSRGSGRSLDGVPSWGQRVVGA